MWITFAYDTYRHSLVCLVDLHPHHLISAALQLIPHRLPTQIRHRHDLDHQARPASKMLRTLALARLRIILLPREARLLPALIHRVDEVLP
jgi:hypothetical protein